MLDRIDAVLIHQIAKFLRASECRALALGNSYLRSVTGSSELWKTICLSQVQGFADYNEENLLQLSECLDIPTFYQLYCVAKNLSFDLVGYYFSLATSITELFIVRKPVKPEHLSGLEGYSINSSGKSSHRFRTQFHPASCSLHAVDAATGAQLGCLTLGECMHVPSMILRRVGYTDLYDDAELNRVGSVIATSTCTIPCSLNIINAVQRGVTALAQHPSAGSIALSIYSCLGFCTGVYGPHGREILYLSIREISAAATGDSPLEPGATPRLELTALKITGDPNVPAGKHSFVINLSQRMNIAEELERDQRLIVIFGEQNHAVLTPQTRLPSLAAWYRGKGQINRSPGVWSPEWVDCSFWVYSRPLPSTGVRCTVVWDDREEGFRHAIDVHELSTTIQEEAEP